MKKNYSVPSLIEEAIYNYEGDLSSKGSFVVKTGEYTGRSAKAKFIVKDQFTKNNVNWNDNNQPISEASFEKIEDLFNNWNDNDWKVSINEWYSQDLFVGADESSRLSIRVITEFAWHSIFAKNMFITPTKDELVNFEPDCIIMCMPSITHYLRVNDIDIEEIKESDPFVLINFTKKLILISGTEYAGEIKKSAFTLMNYLLPNDGILPMHCSVNNAYPPDCGGDSAIFFGLSGTGKTSLSADSHRFLVGDDEHGWNDNGLFNFEGGCYAKVINLDETSEPQIYNACNKFGTILENVILDDDRQVDFYNNTITENTRASYPITHLPGIIHSGRTYHPDNIIMLTCDAFGVLPPLSHLSTDEALYYFLSGYTAKIAGTEMGLGDEPQAIFSTCFGEPFMPRHPSVYADLLKKKIVDHDVTCWLVNTGWVGGGYGQGERINIEHTRELIRFVLNYHFVDIADRFSNDNIFGLSIPDKIMCIPDGLLDPRSSWDNKEEYDKVAQNLIDKFIENFKQYEAYVTFKPLFKNY